MPHHIDIRGEGGTAESKHLVVVRLGGSSRFLRFFGRCGSRSFGNGSRSRFLRLDRSFGPGRCRRSLGLRFHFGLNRSSLHLLLLNRFLHSLGLLFGRLLDHSLLGFVVVGRSGTVEGVEIDMPHHLGSLGLGNNGFYLFRFSLGLSIVFGLGRCRSFDALFVPFETNALRLEFQTLVLAKLLHEQGILFVGYLGIGISLYRKTFLLQELDSGLDSYI